MYKNFPPSTSLNSKHCPGVFDFEGTDSHKSLKKVRKKFPHLVKPVKYTLNSQGYRCPEFGEIDWSNSLITLGCSNTLGIGVDDKLTYSHQLQKNLDIPVVNLGQGGVGMWHIVYLARSLAKLKPKHVVLQVPNPARFSLFFSYGKTVKTIGSWSDGPERIFISQYGEECNAETYQSFAVDYISHLLNIDYMFSFDEENDKLAQRVDILDFARDAGHPGPKTHKAVADNIADYFKSSVLQ